LTAYHSTHKVSYFPHQKNLVAALLRPSFSSAKKICIQKNSSQVQNSGRRKKMYMKFFHQFAAAGIFDFLDWGGGG
jgi:hypothetical protein